MASGQSKRSEHPEPPSRGQIRQLLEWYDSVKRSLPWRRDTDPYRVWLSEVMLQQTRVETAIGYYQRFLRRFPTVDALARASADEVHALWSGLGYYRRATQLSKAARKIVAAGGFPETSEGWLELPGVGPYTAAAIASICFDEPVVALDGNLERVLARLAAFEGDPKKAAGRRFLCTAGKFWLDPARPGDTNQALMELGATVCLPTNPRCTSCPIPDACRARAGDAVDRIPYRPKPEPKERHDLLAVCVRRGSRLLLFRRDSGSTLLAGTWETPWVARTEPNVRAALARRYGGGWTVGKKVGAIRHTITRHQLLLTLHEGTCEAPSQVEEGREARWVGPKDLAALPHSSLVRKIFRAVLPG